jgi:RNA polymerase sigma-70 factor (ECF subfamily)
LVPPDWLPYPSVFDPKEPPETQLSRDAAALEVLSPNSSTNRVTAISCRRIEATSRGWRERVDFVSTSRLISSSRTAEASGRSLRRRSAVCKRSEGVCPLSLWVTPPYTSEASRFQPMRNEDFDQLYEEHAGGLYGFLAYRTGDAALAEDLVADTFERVLTARRPFDRRQASQKTWLYSIALNRLRDVARREEVESRALAASSNGHSGNGHEAIEQVATRQVIMAALATLEETEREVIALRYGADLRLEEIAKVIGKRRSTVEGRLYRGLRRLRSELERESRALADVGSMP